MSKDLFDDTTMSFGEHLEILRTHLLRAIFGLTIGIIIALFYSDHVVRAMLVPVERALITYYGAVPEGEAAKLKGLSESNWWDTLTNWVNGKQPATTGNSAGVTQAPGTGTTTVLVEKPDGSEAVVPETAVNPATVPVQPITDQPSAKYVVAHMDAVELLRALHKIDSRLPEPAADAQPHLIAVHVPESELKGKMEIPRSLTSPVTLNAEEAFMVYMKVAMVTGLVISSPWVFYQIWLFVAAGLYPHERKYIYTYLPMSLGLFLGGALFCFYFVIPGVLDFLFTFNAWLHLRPEIRITEWISFAVILPLMFGVSFQLPMVMLFLERISIFNADVYRTQRRMAILVIAIISMVLTPSDPMSMMLMMVPLCLLYEVGIMLCNAHAPKSPFEAAGA